MPTARDDAAAACLNASADASLPAVAQSRGASYHPAQPVWGDSPIFSDRQGLSRARPWPACAALLAVCGMLAAGPVSAGPWLDPGDSNLRSDLQLLADEGILPMPMTAWPLSWGDVAQALDGLRGQPSDRAAGALARVERRARAATLTGETRLLARAALGTDSRQIRTFENTPREDAELDLGIEWTGNILAARLQGQWVDDPEDGKEWRGDGSYLGIALGNWMVAGSITDRWWGPGWQSSVILSNNARPIPAFTIDRNFTTPFESRWLSWLGHWDASAIWGFLEDDRAVPNARFFGLRFTFRPLEYLEIGLSRSAIWCGSGRPCDFDTFIDLLLGRDNAGENVSAENEPGDQLAGYDLRLTGMRFGWPVALYAQRIGEDEKDFLPSLFLTQVGIETWGHLEGLGTYRVYFEATDTLCGGNLTGGGKPNVCYNHPIYQTGVRYRGRAIGASFDNDAKIFTLGGVLTDERDHAWLATLAYGDLNRKGRPDPANTVAAVETDYGEAELIHRRPFWVGDWDLGLGYEYRKNRVTGESDDDWRVFLQWRFAY